MGLLIKKPMIEYKEPNLSRAILIIVIIYTIGVIVALSSCNPVKKAYEGVAKYNPETSKDTANFYKRAKDLIKPQAPIIKPGKTVKVPYPVEKLKKVIDTAILTRITDSLGIAHSSEINDIVDDCMVSVRKAREEGVKAGYDRANYENYINGKEITTDTAFYPDQSTVIMLDECQLNLRESQSKNISLTAERDIYKGQSKQRFWLLIILGSGLLASLFFNFKKKTLSIIK